MTAVAFVAGLLIGVGPLRTLVGKGDGAPVVTAAAAAGPCTPDRTGSPAEPSTLRSIPSTSAATETGAGGSSPTTAPTTASSAQQPADDGDDGSQLPPALGYLLVHSAAEEAYVYVSGRLAGPVGEKLRVSCGVRPVRLGTKPLSKWLGPIKAVAVACRRVTSVDMDPAPTTAQAPGARPRPKPRPTTAPRGTAYVPADL
jgi:hypothetical protein